LKPAASAAVNGYRPAFSAVASSRLVNLFHFGTFSAGNCSAPATLEVNLIGGGLRVWTKFRSGNTLANVLHH
jgi:hypothetical protein